MCCGKIEVIFRVSSADQEFVLERLILDLQ